MKKYNFYIYIITNPNRTVLYVGVTNNLARRLQEHFDNRGNRDSFTGKYYCYNLVHYEEFKYINDAIAREKQLKNWNRKKKNWLIDLKNPEWHFLNKEFPFIEEIKA